MNWAGRGSPKEGSSLPPSPCTLDGCVEKVFTLDPVAFLANPQVELEQPGTVFYRIEATWESGIRADGSPSASGGMSIGIRPITVGSSRSVAGSRRTMS